mmetsp:Transcript_1145/g.3820  ORF Transcript_1145/g.3820 Transcript_1145/m.3820 type:complete len:269 (-) Transcript_1145:251-1057(-)
MGQVAGRQDPLDVPGGRGDRHEVVNRVAGHDLRRAGERHVRGNDPGQQRALEAAHPMPHRHVQRHVLHEGTHRVAWGHNALCRGAEVGVSDQHAVLASLQHGPQSLPEGAPSWARGQCSAWLHDVDHGGVPDPPAHLLHARARAAEGAREVQGGEHAAELARRVPHQEVPAGEVAQGHGAQPLRRLAERSARPDGHCVRQRCRASGHAAAQPGAGSDPSGRRGRMALIRPLHVRPGDVVLRDRPEERAVVYDDGGSRAVARHEQVCDV